MALSDKRLRMPRQFAACGEHDLEADEFRDLVDIKITRSLQRPFDLLIESLMLSRAPI
jgi:hypothetical protein